MLVVFTLRNAALFGKACLALSARTGVPGSSRQVHTCAREEVTNSSSRLSPITRASRATSMTSAPAVVRLIVAMASVVVVSGMSRPRWAKAVVMTMASSPAARVR
ncbi:hypothetical protein GCM10009734_24260 [Nonomuraea bangladeshensis]